jgi:hypothetical protein
MDRRGQLRASGKRQSMVLVLRGNRLVVGCLLLKHLLQAFTTS